MSVAALEFHRNPGGVHAFPCSRHSGVFNTDHHHEAQLDRRLLASKTARHTQREGERELVEQLVKKRTQRRRDSDSRRGEREREKSWRSERASHRRAEADAWEEQRRGSKEGDVAVAVAVVALLCFA